MTKVANCECRPPSLSGLMGALQDWSAVDATDSAMTMVAVVALVVDLAFPDSAKDATDGVATTIPEVSLQAPRATEYPSRKMASP